MKKILISLIAVLLTSALYAQSLDRHVVATAGGEMKTSSTTLEYTIGETVVGDFSSSSTLLTQGYNQGLIDPGVGVNDVVFNINLKVYPNPATRTLTIDSKENVRIYITDCLGKQHNTSFQVKAGEIQTISVENLASGVYFLKVENNNHQVSTFKWIKV